LVFFFLLFFFYFLRKLWNSISRSGGCGFNFFLRVKWKFPFPARRSRERGDRLLIKTLKLNWCFHDYS
jgi:hypothetical protein